jgi:hypothetical protein
LDLTMFAAAASALAILVEFTLFLLRQWKLNVLNTFVCNGLMLVRCGVTLVGVEIFCQVVNEDAVLQ